MFTCAKIRNGSSYLGGHLTANDYYCENEKVYGLWTGLAAKRLGIEGNLIGAGDAAFEALRQNRIPYKKEKLTPLRKEEGVRFFDFQCSAQKSVSVMAVVMNDKRLYEAHDKAAAKAFAELERFAAFRSGKTREPEISGNLCAAAFRHDASRSLDPQIHTHFVVANATYDEKKKRWLALDTCEMFRAIRYAGKVYQNELAQECRRLGYEIEHVRNGKGVVEGFEIAGISEEIRERYSKRRAEVEAGITRFQNEKDRPPTKQEINVITRETRGQKMAEMAMKLQRMMMAFGMIAAMTAVLYSQESYEPERGFSPGMEQFSGTIDSIDIASGKLHLKLPVESLLPGQGGTGFGLNLHYDSRIYNAVKANNNAWQLEGHPGWNYDAYNYGLDLETDGSTYRLNLLLPDGSSHILMLRGYESANGFSSVKPNGYNASGVKVISGQVNYYIIECRIRFSSTQSSIITNVTNSRLWRMEEYDRRSSATD